jgi:hypothetical protein
MTTTCSQVQRIQQREQQLKHSSKAQTTNAPHVTTSFATDISTSRSAAAATLDARAAAQAMKLREQRKTTSLEAQRIASAASADYESVQPHYSHRGQMEHEDMQQSYHHARFQGDMEATTMQQYSHRGDMDPEPLQQAYNGRSKLGADSIQEQQYGLRRKVDAESHQQSYNAHVRHEPESLQQSYSLRSRAVSEAPQQQYSLRSRAETEAPQQQQHYNLRSRARASTVGPMSAEHPINPPSKAFTVQVVPGKKISGIRSTSPVTDSESLGENKQSHSDRIKV